MLNPSNTLSASYNFDHSKNTNQTFDVADLRKFRQWHRGPVQNRRRQPESVHDAFPDKLNEFHFTYARELRPRNAVTSNLAPDTGMGDPAFRFGNPYFLRPASTSCSGGRRSRTICRSSRDDTPSKSEASGSTRSTIRFFAVLHRPLHVQHRQRVSALRLTPGAGGFGPNAVVLKRWLGHPSNACPAGSTLAGTPLLLYIQETEPAFRTSIRPASRRSRTTTWRCSRKTNGRSARTSPSITACAGTRS